MRKRDAAARYSVYLFYCTKLQILTARLRFSVTVRFSGKTGEEVHVLFDPRKSVGDWCSSLVGL